MVKIAGAILAGGRSSRMGEDKAELCIHSGSLLEHMERVLRNAGVDAVYTSRHDAIADKIPGHGPLSGIHAVLTQIPPDISHIVFVPVDMPELNVSLIRQLMTAPDDVPLVRFEQYALPFRLATNVTWRWLAEKMLGKNHDVSLTSFQKNIPGACLLDNGPINPRCFANINTPDEWNRYMRGMMP